MADEHETKHVSFAAETSEGGVATAVERGQEAAGYVAETVLSYIPGTDEHEVRVHGQNLESSPAGPGHTVPHGAEGQSCPVSFGLSYFCFETLIEVGSYNECLLHTDIAYEHGPVAKPRGDTPRDTIHTAEDIAYTTSK